MLNFEEMIPTFTQLIFNFVSAETKRSLHFHQIEVDQSMYFTSNSFCMDPGTFINCMIYAQAIKLASERKEQSTFKRSKRTKVNKLMK